MKKLIFAGLIFCLSLATVGGCAGGNTVTLKYFIKVTANPEEGGAVSGDGTYNKNTVVTVEATAGTDYIFVNWTEGENEVSNEEKYKFTVTRDRTLTANFEPI